MVSDIFHFQRMTGNRQLLNGNPSSSQILKRRSAEDVAKANRIIADGQECGKSEVELVNEQRRELSIKNRHLHWGSICQTAGSRYYNASIESFETPSVKHEGVVKKVAAFMDRLSTPEQGLVFIGPPGTGKDHLAMAVLRKAVIKYGSNAAYCDGQSLFRAIRDTYSNSGCESDLVDFAIRADLFLISDPVPCNASVTEHQRNILSQIVDGRYRFSRPTIATLNVSDRDELNDRIGDSVADRLIHDALVVPCDWPSYRKSIR